MLRKYIRFCLENGYHESNQHPMNTHCSNVCTDLNEFNIFYASNEEEFYKKITEIHGEDFLGDCCSEQHNKFTKVGFYDIYESCDICGILPLDEFIKIYSFDIKRLQHSGDYIKRKISDELVEKYIKECIKSGLCGDCCEL